MEHHPWCNYWGLPQETCKQCKGLYEKYPLTEDETVDDLMEKHFPDVIKRPGT